MEYKKRHNNWNDFKKILEDIDIFIPFKEREIWWAALGVNIGTEIDGKGENFERPIIIIKKFNKEQMLAVPLSRVKIPKTGIHVPLYHWALDAQSTGIITQLQTVNNRRLLRFIGILPRDQFSILVKAVDNILPQITRSPADR
jgi:mRNA interferase MazF